MYSVLCDRCLACAHTVLQNFNLDKDIENTDEFTQHLKYILEIMNRSHFDNNIYNIIEQLNMNFFHSRCEDCIEIYTNANKAIELYCKEYLVDKVFSLLCKNKHEQYLENVIKNIDFKYKVQFKLITFNINKKGNKETINYYPQKFISYNDLKEVPYFRILNSLPRYYKHIFGVPIYIANIPRDEYLKRQKMNLKELLPKHRLCLV